MSPGISLAIDVPGRMLPRAQVLHALAIARSKDLPLYQGAEPGVVPARWSNAWIIDRRRRIPAINLVGAVLIAFQPDVNPDEDLSGIAARTLGVGLPFIEGCSDGWALESMSEHWLKADRRAYMAGYFAGCEGLFAATLVCGRCGARRFKVQAVCDGCSG